MIILLKKSSRSFVFIPGTESSLVSVYSSVWQSPSWRGCNRSSAVLVKRLKVRLLISLTLHLPAIHHYTPISLINTVATRVLAYVLLSTMFVGFHTRFFYCFLLVLVKKHTPLEFSTANRSVKIGLLASSVVSAWTWAATLLQSSSMAYSYGVSGPYWWGASHFSFVPSCPHNVLLMSFSHPFPLQILSSLPHYPSHFLSPSFTFLLLL